MHARLLCFVGVLLPAPSMTTFRQMQICVYIRIMMNKKNANARRSELQATKLLSQTRFQECNGAILGHAL